MFVSQDIGTLDTLNYINLSFNVMDQLIFFKNFPGLREVVVSHNKIEEVEVNVDELTASTPWLETIDLKGNPLKENSRVFLQSIVRLKILLD